MQNKIIDDLSFDAYQEQRGISQSFLREFARCPLCAYEYMHGEKKPPTEAMIIGSAVDCLLCEPELLGDKFHMRPESYPAKDEFKPWNGNATWCKEWLAAHTDKPVITPAQLERVDAMVAAVKADPYATEILHGCKVQQSVFWKDEKTGLAMKGRPDFVGQRYAIDLKTCADASTGAISHAIMSYRLHVQAALYTDGLQANGRECNTFYFLFVENGERPKCNVRMLKLEALDLGRMTYQMQLAKVKECFDSGEWPGFSGVDGIQTIDVPQWAYNQWGGAEELIIGGEAHAL